MGNENKKSNRPRGEIGRSLKLVLVLSVVPLLWLFIDGRLWHTHDGLVHVPRLAAYYTALTEGHIPPRFAGHINFGFGVPLFIFIYHVPYLIGSLFIFLGFSLIRAFELSLALSYVISGITMFFFGRAFFKDNTKALWVMIFYQFAPYRFVELHMRGSYGGVYTYAFLPLLLFALVRLFEKQTYYRFAFAGISAGLLIMSHNSLSLAFYGVTSLFIIFFCRTVKNAILGFSTLVLGLLLSAWYFVPALVEHKYTYGDLLMKDVFYDHFVPWWQYLVPNFYYAESLRFEAITAQFGMMHVVAIVLCIVLLIKKRANASDLRLYWFSLLIMGGTVFLMQPISTWIWAHVPLMSQFQFPWRLLGIVVIATSLLSVSYLSFSFMKSKGAQYIVLGLTIFTTIYYWNPLYGYDDVDEQFFWNFPYNTTYYGETDVIWSAGPAENYPSSPVEVAAGYAIVGNYQKKSHLHTFTVTATESARLVDNTQYFPGWRVFVDGKKVPVEFQDQNWRGRITFDVTAGTHDVVVEFGRSKVRLVSEIVSVATLICLLIYGAMRRIFYGKTNRSG